MESGELENDPFLDPVEAGKLPCREIDGVDGEFCTGSDTGMTLSDGKTGVKISWIDTPGLANLFMIAGGADCFSRLSIIPGC